MLKDYQPKSTILLCFFCYCEFAIHSFNIFDIILDMGPSYHSPLCPSSCSNLSQWVNLVDSDHHNRKICNSCSSEVINILSRVTVFKSKSIIQRHWTSSINTSFYIIPVTIFVIVFNIPRFLELKTCFNDSIPDVCPTELRMKVSYSRQYICLQIIFVTLI